MQERNLYPNILRQSQSVDPTDRYQTMDGGITIIFLLLTSKMFNWNLHSHIS